MLESLYIGMTGLLTFSKGLSNIGNNVANMNTTGFKGSQLNFLDLSYQYQHFNFADSGSTSYARGSGVGAGSTSLRFSQGDIRDTGNDLDLAIDGQGFFVLADEKGTRYTRSGQLEFDAEGILVSREDGARVMGLSGGNLTEISLSGHRSSPPSATSSVRFSDFLSTGDSTFTVPGIVLFDSLGAKHDLTLEFTNDITASPARWTFVLREGTTDVTTGELRFLADGTADPAFASHTFSFSPSGGAVASGVTLDFAATSSFSSGGSTMRVESQDGRAAGFLTRTTFDVDGNLVLSYSNGASDTSQLIAIAVFADAGVLEQAGANRFSATDESGRLLGQAGTSSFGKLAPGKLELSNVELAQEFGELIVVQRSYQASSQVLSAANEMLQQLGDIRGRR